MWNEHAEAQYLHGSNDCMVFLSIWKPTVYYIDVTKPKYRYRWYCGTVGVSRLITWPDFDWQSCLRCWHYLDAARDLAVAIGDETLLPTAAPGSLVQEADTESFLGHVVGESWYFQTARAIEIGAFVGSHPDANAHATNINPSPSWARSKPIPSTPEWKAQNGRWHRYNNNWKLSCKTVFTMHPKMYKERATVRTNCNI